MNTRCIITARRAIHVVLVIGALGGASAVAETVYVGTGEAGEPSFSDRPSPEATTIELQNFEQPALSSNELVQQMLDTANELEAARLRRVEARAGRQQKQAPNEPEWPDGERYDEDYPAQFGGYPALPYPVRPHPRHHRRHGRDKLHENHGRSEDLPRRHVDESQPRPTYRAKLRAPD